MQMRKGFYLIIFLIVATISTAWPAKSPAIKELPVRPVFQSVLAASFNLPKQLFSKEYIAALKKVTDVMVNDVTSPVAASRYYAYITLTAYETQSLFDSLNYPSLSGHLNKFFKKPVDAKLVQSSNESLAVILAIFKSGEKLLPSGYMLQSQTDSLAALYSKNAREQSLFQNTLTLVNELLQQVMQYAKADGFSRLNNLKRYTPETADGYWKPTPPVFMAPVEPNWSSLRTFVLDSAQQFKVLPPTIYDTSRSSSFFIQLMEVYNITNAANQSQKDIAMFWDCNPFAVQQIGHVEFGLKKISPGGHWIGIAGIACLKQKLPLGKTALAHVLVSISLADAFIACWDEKYRSNRIRPETAIQKLIDPRWHPLLQTPPFPEYVSGHSVASTAAAFTLTKIFGNQFSFADDTETEFGLPVRKYDSFFQAASEAAISRLYGGIHYKDAIVQGEWQGEQIGRLIVQQLIEK
jgi:membrane-associated phospholipid phosphatase